MRKFKYSFLVALGFLIFATIQYAFSAQDAGMGASQQRVWGSGPATGGGGVKGVEPGGGSCNFTTLRFDELPSQPVNGLGFRGVRFIFTDLNDQDFADARYNATGPGILTFVQDPSLEGSAFGVLSLEFPALTPTLSFGLARNTFEDIDRDGGEVVLLDNSGGVILFTPLITRPRTPGGFAEGFFNYTGPTPVRRVAIFFNNRDQVSRFAIDNLGYRAFDIVLQDDADPNEVLQINSVTGDFQFLNCATGASLEGTGGAVRFGCNFSLGTSGGGNKGGPPTVNASANTCTNQGSATVRLNNGTTVTINDSNITNNICCEGNNGK